jgi:hypothetical protein
LKTSTTAGCWRSRRADGADERNFERRRVASMLAVLLGNMVSFYLTFLNGVRPADVAAIDHVKAQLARGR